MTKATFLITLMATVGLPALTIAPAAFAADDNKQYSRKKFDTVKKRSSTSYRTPQREEKRPENRRSSRSDSSGDRTRRNDNARSEGSRSNHSNGQRVTNNTRNNNQSRNGSRSNHRRRDDTRSHNTRRNNTRQNDWRRDRRWNSRNDRYWRRQNRRNTYRPYWNTSSYTGWNDRYYGYQTNYRSSLGISFIFGQPGYSRYRWAPSRYSFYRPEYTTYNSYQATTYCERVVIDGFHMGHSEQVSVMQCSNPYEGTYLVQGSEQVVYCRH